MADPPSYWLTRFLFLRLLGLVYAVAFLVILYQWPPLLGSRSLLPAREPLVDGSPAHACTCPLTCRAVRS